MNNDDHFIDKGIYHIDHHRFIDIDICRSIGIVLTIPRELRGGFAAFPGALTSEVSPGKYLCDSWVIVLFL